MSAKVSVVIAVYNMEPHIRQCVESVLHQTIADVEVICVDDVSTDGSLQLIREMAAADPRVKVIEQTENGGAQLARNAGIAASTGQFITVLDDDDFLAPDALEQALQCFDGRQDVQCVLLRELRIRPDGSVFDPPGRYSFSEASGEEIYYRSMPWHVSGRYVVRRDLQLRILFDNADRVYGEDNTARLHFLESPRIIQSQGIYYYRLLPDSLSHAMNMAVFWVLKSHEAMSQHLIDGGYALPVRRAHEHFRWLNVVHAMMHLYKYGHHYTKQQQAEALALIRHNRAATDFTLVPLHDKVKLGYMPMRLLGWKAFVWQENIYFTLKKLTGRL